MRPGIRAGAFVALTMFAVPCTAAPAAPAAPAPSVTLLAPDPVASVGTDFLDEGFEGSWPPPGWKRTAGQGITGQRRWHQSSDSAHVRTGSFSSAVRWQNAADQNERLDSPALDLTGAVSTGLRLSFWWYGNPFWAPNADLQVQASTDSTSWTTLWTMSSVPQTGWGWRNTVIDVGAWAGGMFHLRLLYTGRDGADVAVDDVALGYINPPAPPGNDDCAGAAGDPMFVLSAAAPFTRNGDNTWASADYPLAPSGCTGYTHTGRDVVWVFDVPAWHDLVVTMTTAGHWDDTLFLVSDCASPAATCLAGANALPDGSQITWANAGFTTRRVYLIASGYSGADAGAFTLSGAIQPGTAVETSSWGRVKAGYR